METIEATAAAYCVARRKGGAQCDAPEAGACQACERETEEAFRCVTSLECFGCGRMALPGLTWFHRPVCSSCAPNALSADMLHNDVDGDLAKIEAAALASAGNDAGAYLDGLRKTDLARLTEAEWLAFLARVLKGYSAAMRLAVKECPPF